MGKWWVVAALLVALGLGGWVYFHRAQGVPGAERAEGRPGPREMRDLPVPVSTQPVQLQDVPFYLDGLGTVQAYNMVTVRAQVDGLLTSLEFHEGQEVKKGQVLARIDPREYRAQLDQQQAQHAQAAAQLRSAELDLERYIDLSRKNYVSAQQLDTQRQTVAQYAAAVKASEAAIANAQVSLDYTTITSPIDGVTGIRGVDVGNLVQSASTSGLVVVTQVQPVSLVFTLPEQTLSDIRAAGKGPLRVLALDRANRLPIAQGELAVIDNLIDQTTGTIKLKATFPNEDKKLWPGQFVNVRLLVRTDAGVPVVPAAAIQRGPEGDFVYIAEDGVAHTRKLSVARNAEGLAVIAQGLAVGERVIVDGQSRLRDGAKIVSADATGPSKRARAADAAAGADAHR